MLEFTKMESLGNDFIIIKGPATINPSQIANYCDRHFGIGADGFIVVSAINDNYVEMEYWNSDGSVAEMCGNGLRCLTRFAVDNHMVTPGDFRVSTKVGDLQVVYDGENFEEIKVQVGKVNVEKSSIRLFGVDLHIANAGNPHAVTFVDNVETAPVQEQGSKIESDPHFPNKTNVEFVEIQSPNSLKVRIWERGVGETLACGTGMVASVAVAEKQKDLELPTIVKAPGGEAIVDIDQDGYYTMTGPAHVVYKGKTKN